MKKPTQKQIVELLKEKPFIIPIVGLTFLLLSPVIELMGKLIFFIGGAYCLVFYVKQYKKK